MVDEPAMVQPPALVEKPPVEPAPEELAIVQPPVPPGSVAEEPPPERVDAPVEQAPSVVPLLPPPAISRLSASAGPLAGGTRLVIEGTGFVDGCVVKVDRVPVMTTSTSATEIAFAAPPRNVEGRVDIDVVNPDGQWTTLLQSFEYCMSPTLTGITPDHAPQTGGVRATLSGTSLRDGSEVRIGAARPGVEYRGSTRIELVIGSHPAGTYDVELRGPDGQEARLPAAFHFQGPPVIERLVPEHGPFDTATPVVVEGSGFRTGCSLYLDRERVAAELQSGTRLVARVPARERPGLVAVRVINADGLRGRRSPRSSLRTVRAASSTRSSCAASGSPIAARCASRARRCPLASSRPVASR
jgi:hypothetical protein